ncbi:MAG: RDD family protein [Anaerolineae bacterium]|nr:RDD family protein [Anaerolineae bacterium]
MNQSEQYLNIDTPENVVFGYEVAGIATRFMAAFIDTILFLILQTIVFTVVFSAFSLTGMAVAGVVAALSFIFSWGYYVFFEMAWNGQTPGKYWAELRVIRRDGSPITLVESAIRNLVRPIDFLPFGYAIGVIVMFLNRDASRLGDLAAGTLVVYAHEDVTLSSLELENRSRTLAQTQVPEMVAQWPIERLSRQEIEMADQFLQRQYSLQNGNLGQQITHHLLNKMGVSADEASGLETPFLIRSLVTQWYKQQEKGGGAKVT